jgi:hypothetical protein
MPVIEEQAMPDLPDVIVTYQTAHDRRDASTALASFTEDAVVEDDGKTYRGREEVAHWLNAAASEFTFTRTLLSAEETADGWLVTNHIEGDFPGGQVDLRYAFKLDGALIEQLVIAPYTHATSRAGGRTVRPVHQRVT